MDDSGLDFGERFVRRYNATIESIVNTLYWVIIALILAFVFRTFIMEAFQIPTGSMAETLRGKHYHLRCLACGYKYDLGSDEVSLGTPKCSSCGYVPDEEIKERASNGDRILVLKCIYEFVEPKRWDVVVFKYPVHPEDNYIKRMIALPGETVELIDGDVYINGQIARKPAKVQDELFNCVFDNDYGRIEVDGAGKWVYPFANTDGSAWKVNEDGGRKFSLNSTDGHESRLVYRNGSGKDFEAEYVYNHRSVGSYSPVCSDLKVRSYIRAGQEQGTVGIGLRKYGRLYRGRVDFDGAMVIEKTFEGETVVLASKDIFVDIGGRAKEFSFANVDHELTLVYGGEKLVYDLGTGPNDAGIVDRNERGKLVYREGGMVEIFGAGEVDLYHTAVFKDIYYLDETALRPRYEEPFVVGEDEFFLCGDNSPASFDCRSWATKGKGNNNAKYRTGIVPRDYLMGKAFFLYWGDAFEPFENMLPVVPNFSEMKFIYGGGKERQK